MKVWYTATVTFVLEGAESFSEDANLASVRRAAQRTVSGWQILVKKYSMPPEPVRARIVLDRLVLDAEALKPDER